MQSEEVSFRSAFERGQRLGCSDVHSKVTPPSWGQKVFISYTLKLLDQVCGRPQMEPVSVCLGP